MLTRSLLLCCSVLVSTVLLLPHTPLQADDSPETPTSKKKKHAVTIRLDIDGNDVQWNSDGGGASEDLEVVELLHGMLAEPGNSQQQEKRIIVLKDRDQAEGENDHEGHAAEIRKIIERVHRQASNHAKDKKSKARVMVFRGDESEQPQEYQAIVVGDEDDVERVDLGDGKVWIRRLNRMREGDGPSYRLGIMLGEPVGVMILDTVEDSPAAKAGLQAGDLLLAVDGQPVRNPSMLIARVAEAGNSDEPLRLMIVRDDFKQVKTIDVRPEAIQEESADESPSEEDDDGEEHAEHESEHAESHDHDHGQDFGHALDELRGEVDELRAKIKRLQRSLKDGD